MSLRASHSRVDVYKRQELEIIRTPQEADQLAETVEDAGGVSFVPAFTGLGAPSWDMYARGALLGGARGTTRARLCRAVLESIARELSLIHI